MKNEELLMVFLEDRWMLEAGSGRKKEKVRRIKGRKVTEAEPPVAAARTAAVR